MHYKRLQKYGKKLAVAVLTSAVLLASGATVYADDTVKSGIDCLP